nr:hypothetical protein [Azospirillum sp. 412522]
MTKHLFALSAALCCAILCSLAVAPPAAAGEQGFRTGIVPHASARVIIGQ